MITRKKFDFIKSKYGKFCSWAVWAKVGDTATSNMKDLTVLDPDITKGLLSTLNPNVVLVALNFSRGSVKNSFGNFHEYHPHMSDYKTRFALRGSKCWGGYMTDIIKNYSEKKSGKLMKYLKSNKPFELKNAEFFRKELKDIGSKNPVLVAFGRNVETILKRNFKDEFRILKITHYAHHVNLEKYRKEVHSLF